ncbi:uncharacterized protein TERG_04309 [Trichophyton rubrum CBS 118892]|uniref:ABC transmembrane type-1 domain-containing protein n=1 Tax=Trichophyton rubrum (strain ATCC MYA-4607 / CBS 118892) TaxID=559305 RepID=F2SMZ6_TRIRC|nr:uncharacterized protein TERG_04309 [Trichophyton rubrum CBS 118892]EGD88057.2 hypothetical protein TERG_04309 [Trichophyton rubrum CBS 118892]
MALYRYAIRNDKIVLVLASVAAIIAGALMPMMTVLFGGLAGTFRSFLLGDISDSKFNDELATFSLYFVYLAIGEFAMVYIATVGFVYSGEHIIAKIREQFLAAILRQNIAFFDELGAGEITTRIIADTNLVQEGISEKVGLTLTAITTFVAALVISFIRYWKLALILCSSIVAIVVTFGLVGTFVAKLNKKYLGHSAEGGTVVEEVISSTRNPVAFNTQEKLARRYDGYRVEAKKSGFKLKSATSSMIGFLFLYIYPNYGLSFWMGSRFLVDGSVGLAQILTIQMAIMMGAFALGNITSNVQAITTAVATANKIYATIDRVSPLDPLSNDADKSTALVGASGSGKSTIVGLIERFYDPVGGSLYIDGHNIKGLKLRWLRQQISLYTYKRGSGFLVFRAHDFISSLPERYETNIGERGILLSGGQKQRIAIARAIGTHDELPQKKATYCNLVEAQQIATKQESTTQDNDHISPETEYDLPQAEYNNEKRDSLSQLDEGEEPQDLLIHFVAGLNKQEWKYMVFGISLGIVCGGGSPTQTVFFSKCITALSLPLSESSEIRRQVNFWSLMYLMLAFVQLLALIAQGITFSYCAERLTYRVRYQAFRHILRQDIAYFDKRSGGTLTFFLSPETSQLAGLSGITPMAILLMVATLLAASAIGLAVGWKATLAIRTVASLTREGDICSHYHAQLLSQGRSLVWSVLTSPILYAASQSLQFLCMALGFWYGVT